MAEAPEFKPEEAVTFLSNFGHDPEALKSQDPEQIKGLYEKTTGFLNTHVEEKVKAIPPFRENWREAIAANDPEALKTLQRFTDPGAMFKSYRELRGKMDSGELKAQTPFPKDGKPEEQAAWRAERGIPEKPEAYLEKVKLKEGLVIGEQDKPFVNDFLTTAHANNLPPEVVNEQLNWYFGQHLPKLEATRAAFDADNRTEAHVKLHEAWGADFKGNMNAVASLVQTMPEGIRDGFYGARLPDGRAFGDSPEVMQWLASMARELNPASTLTGTQGADAMKGIDERIAAHEKTMRENRPAWNKDVAAQKEYQELLDLRDRNKGKKAA